MNKSKSSSLLDNTPWILYPIVAPVYYLLIYPLTLFGAAVLKLVSFLFSPIYNLFFGTKKTTPGKFKLAATNDFVAANAAPLSPVKPCVPKNIPSNQHQNAPESTIKKLGNPEGSIGDSSDNSSQPTPVTTPIKKSPEKVTEENRKTLIEIQPDYYNSTIGRNLHGKNSIEFAFQILLHFIATHTKDIKFKKNADLTLLSVAYFENLLVGARLNEKNCFKPVTILGQYQIPNQDIVRASSLLNHILLNIYVLGFISEIQDTLHSLKKSLDDLDRKQSPENKAKVKEYLTQDAADRYFINGHIDDRSMTELCGTVNVCLKIHNFTLMTSFTQNKNCELKSFKFIKSLLDLLDILDLANHEKANLFKSKISNLNLAYKVKTKHKIVKLTLSMDRKLSNGDKSKYLKSVHHRHFHSDISQENSPHNNEQPLKLADLVSIIENGTDSVQNIYDLLTTLKNSCHTRTPEVIEFFANEDFFQSVPMNLDNSPSKGTLTSITEDDENRSNYTTPAHSPVRTSLSFGAKPTL